MQRKLLGMLVAVSSLILGAQTASAQTVAIRGRVVSPDGHALSDAEVRIRGTSFAASSDSIGAFEIKGIPSGHVILDARRLGFLAQQFELDLVTGRDRRVELMLPVVPHDLPNVRVSDTLGKPARYANTHRYDVFFERRSTGIGKFFTREDIDAQFKSYTPQLLQGLSGVKTQRVGDEWKVQFTRCQMALRGDPSDFIQVFIDGHYVGHGDELNSIHPSEIEAMEVYRSPAELPPQARGNGCGAVFIWTRNGS